jgi:transposase-like protein
MPHPKHEEHLCYLQNLGYVQSNLKDYKKLVTNSRFVCKNCGRTAASDKNLCAPEKL